MGYLPKGLETRVILQSPVAIAARVVDSGGFVVAKSQAFANVQALSFKAPPYAGNRLRAAGVAGASHKSGGLTGSGLAADDTAYYLEIAPADGVDVSQPYDVQIGTTTAIPDKVTIQVYLPVVLR